MCAAEIAEKLRGSIYIHARTDNCSHAGSLTDRGERQVEEVERRLRASLMCHGWMHVAATETAAAEPARGLATCMDRGGGSHTGESLA